MCCVVLCCCRSRFPGLHVWLSDGQRLPVSIPPGCLLCQAGKQLEWLTGGYVAAGMHEVGSDGAALSMCWLYRI